MTNMAVPAPFDPIDPTGEFLIKEFDPLSLLTKDMKAAASTLSPREVRYLVNYYYLTQKFRVTSNNQRKALTKRDEPHLLVDWIARTVSTLENNIKSSLLRYAQAHQMGVWAMKIRGIGPVLAAGLLAHINMAHCPTVGHIWSFGGFDPTAVWKEGEVRPWNAKLKTIFWKIGESFAKVANHEEGVYGKVYQIRKKLEWERNIAGEFSEKAKASLKAKNYDKSTFAYPWYAGLISKEAAQEYLIAAAGSKVPVTPRKAKEGEVGIPMLAPAHIYARSKRYAVKLFLSHWHHRAHEIHYGVPPPRPFVIEHLGHAHMIPPPL